MENLADILSRHLEQLRAEYERGLENLDGDEDGEANQFLNATIREIHQTQSCLYILANPLLMADPLVRNFQRALADYDQIAGKDDVYLPLRQASLDHLNECQTKLERVIRQMN